MRRRPPHKLYSLGDVSRYFWNVSQRERASAMSGGLVLASAGFVLVGVETRQPASDSTVCNRLTPARDKKIHKKETSIPPR